MTLSIPDDLHKKMKRHSELKWSEIARQAFEKRISEIELMDKMLENSTLSEEDAEKIGHKINATVRKRIHQHT